MAYESASFDANIAAAAGDDPALLAELRAVFADSVEQQCDLLSRARCDANWRVAAQRIRSLAASFHAAELVDLAEEAIDGAPGDPVVLRKMRLFASELLPKS